MDEAGALEVTVAPLDAGLSHVRVRGEVDMATASELEAVLAGRPRAERIVLDLTECTLLDSYAIRVVLLSADRAQASGGAIAVVAPESGIRRTLEISGVDTRVSIHPNVEAARVEADQLRA
jgi:anti-sigma B factor antagonist